MIFGEIEIPDELLEEMDRAQEEQDQLLEAALEEDRDLWLFVRDEEFDCSE